MGRTSPTSRSRKHRGTGRASRTPARQTQLGGILSDVPPQYARDPSIVSKHFLTVPPALLRLVRRYVGPQVNSGAWQRENDLAQVSGDHSTDVGFFDGRTITYGLLRPRVPLETALPGVPVMVRDGKLKPMWPGITGAQFRNVLEVADQRLGNIHDIARGYCGWLLTDSTFLAEHEALFSRWGRQVAQQGLPATGTNAVFSSGSATSMSAQYANAVDAFCVRWQLAGLAAPYLPIPLQPQLPLASIKLVTQLMQSGGSLVFFPFIYPVLSRDELRRVLEDVLRTRTAPPHLAGWMKIVAANNLTKMTLISRYGRVFELQHYHRLLHERHTPALKGKLTQLMAAYAQFLGVSTSTVDADAKFIRKRRRGG